MFLNQCVFYAAGLYLTYALDDLSFKANASQSPIFPSSSSSYHWYEASNAIDRNTKTCMRTDAIGIGPSAPSRNTWWKVDLGAIYNIYSIDVLFKDYGKLEEYRQRGRFAGFSLYISNTGNVKGSILCYKDGPELPPLNITTTCTEYGRYVIFYNERMDEVGYPDGYQLTNVFTELCEVIVKGCKKHDVYGTACDIPCPDACKNNICHIQSGSCLECESGLYGHNCNILCPTNCNNNTCNMQNGTCFTCKSGWTGIYCKTKCIDGWYGANCSQRCSEHCRDSTPCNNVNGQCDKGCDAGWRDSLCVKECDNETYGYNCTNYCSGHCLNDSPCNKKTGLCDEGCDPGYRDNNCSKECERNTFGLDCKEHCSGHCNNSVPCEHVNGVCPGGCQNGYLGAQCFNSCAAGYYGTNCSFQCSPSCNGTCEHMDGSCDHCEEGQGTLCSKDNWTPSTGFLNSPSNNIPITVGMIVGTCVVLTIGAVIFIFISRLKRKANIMKKRESFMLEANPRISIKTRQISETCGSSPAAYKNISISIGDSPACTQNLVTTKCCKMSINVSVLDAIPKPRSSILNDKTIKLLKNEV